MPTDNAVVFTSSSSFTSAFTLATSTGTSQGRWRYDSGGSSASGSTGPGTNNTLSFMHTETSSSGGESVDENNGRAKFSSLPDGVNRVVTMRLAIMGAFQDAAGNEGLRVQYATTDADVDSANSNWTNITVISGWAYGNDYTLDEVFNDLDSPANERTCVANGGWADIEVAIPDNAQAVRLYPNYTYGGSAHTSWQHDIAIRQFQWTYDEASAATVEVDASASAGSPTASGFLSVNVGVQASVETGDPTVTFVAEEIDPPTEVDLDVEAGDPDVTYRAQAMAGIDTPMGIAVGGAVSATASIVVRVVTTASGQTADLHVSGMRLIANSTELVDWDDRAIVGFCSVQEDA